MKYYASICFFWSKANRPTVYIYTYSASKNTTIEQVRENITIAAKASMKDKIKEDIFDVHDILEITRAEYNRA